MRWCMGTWVVVLDVSCGLKYPSTTMQHRRTCTNILPCMLWGVWAALQRPNLHHQSFGIPQLCPACSRDIQPLAFIARQVEEEFRFLHLPRRVQQRQNIEPLLLYAHTQQSVAGSSSDQTQTLRAVGRTGCCVTEVSCDEGRHGGWQSATHYQPALSFSTPSSLLSTPTHHTHLLRLTFNH